MLGDFINTIFPENCIGCSRALYKQEKFLCLHCKSELPAAKYDATTNNPASKLLAGRTCFNTCLPLYYYYRGGKVQNIVKEIKYGKRPELALDMGRRIGLSLVSQHSLNNLNAIIPVPLHPKREKKRGYNQSYFLGKGIAEVLEIPIFNERMVRIVNNRSQTDKSRQERWEKVNSIFSLKNPEELSGMHVLLVDDVITTGSTLESCCAVLNHVNGIKITIATLATA